MKAGIVWCLAVLLGRSSVQAYHSQLVPIADPSNHSGMVTGLSEMINLLSPKTLVLLVLNETKINKIDRLTVAIHSYNIPTCIFYDLEQYFEYIANNLKNSLDTTSLLLCHPADMLVDLVDRRLAHRLSLYIFYWGARRLPAGLDRALLREPLRVAVITNPKKKIFRIFYNQAKPNNRGELLSANWFDGSDMTFKRVPLLPTPTEVYKNFEGRVFTIPVIHKPPWHFLSYTNLNESCNDTDTDFDMANVTSFQVTGGRDHNLMQLIAARMNFTFRYIEPEEKIQGTAMGSGDNVSISGALGMLQRREVDLFLGDVAVTWERMQAVEFSFFTLADSAAFVTHAPRKLSEALALVRPFQITVWPLVIFTIILSGPVLYLIIAMPFRLEDWMKGTLVKARRLQVRRGPPFYDMQYIREMNYGIVPRANIAGTPQHPSLNRCVWYTINVYLRQSATIPYNGHVARFFSILLWLCATYVLGDVYSAQLTSQLARPAREGPINTLGKLEVLMESPGGYKLLVERQSAFQVALANSTGILQRLYRITQRHSDNESYLVGSVEEGIQILLVNSKRAVFGGRETLYFNTKRYGAHRFQLSDNLYTRYSAVAVQFGSPFLDSLNEVIMRLFEAGIIGKITVAEYERMFGSKSGGQFADETVESTKSDDGVDATGKAKKSAESSEKLQPMNLRMLQGAFLALGFGHSVGAIILLVENQLKGIKSVYQRFLGVLTQTGRIVRKIWTAIRRSLRKLYEE